jgi:hypothetical protein
LHGCAGKVRNSNRYQHISYYVYVIDFHNILFYTISAKETGVQDVLPGATADTITPWSVRAAYR